MEKIKPYHIAVIKIGESEVPAPEVYWMRGWNEWEKLSFHILLAYNEDNNFLINTGMPEDLELRNHEMKDFAGERALFSRLDVIEELSKVGFKPEQIKNLSFTPMQDYTTGGISKFRNSKIFINRKGWIEDLMAPINPEHKIRNMFIDEKTLKYLLFEAWNQIKFFDSPEPSEILPGIEAVWVGCHHRSSVAFRILTDNGSYVFTDCSFKNMNLEKRIPIGIAENINECLEAYNKIELYGKVLSAYDPEIDNFMI